VNFDEKSPVLENEIRSIRKKIVTDFYLLKQCDKMLEIIENSEK